jgi:Bacterial Ig-like domain
VRKILIIVTFLISLILIINFALHNIVVIEIPDASAIVNPSPISTNITSSLLTRNITNTTANVLQQALKTQQASIETQQLESFQRIISWSVIGIAITIITPLLFSLYLARPLVMNQVYRVLVAIGVIFTVVLILIYLNSMIWFNIGIQGPNIAALLETQKNFLTIIGTAFASLVAFYFGTRGTQGSNIERPTAATRPELGQKALEVIDVNPIDGSMGVKVESSVTATFSAPVRSSTINPNTFSVKDANGNPVDGERTVTDNNTTIKFNPISHLDRNSRYTVTITKGLMDTSGASMSADKEWHFTTLT